MCIRDSHGTTIQWSGRKINRVAGTRWKGGLLPVAASTPDRDDEPEHAGAHQHERAWLRCEKRLRSTLEDSPLLEPGNGACTLSRAGGDGRGTRRRRPEDVVKV